MLFVLSQLQFFDTASVTLYKSAESYYLIVLVPKLMRILHDNLHLTFQKESTAYNTSSEIDKNEHFNHPSSLSSTSSLSVRLEKKRIIKKATSGITRNPHNRPKHQHALSHEDKLRRRMALRKSEEVWTNLKAHSLQQTDGVHSWTSSKPVHILWREQHACQQAAIIHRCDFGRP